MARLYRIIAGHVVVLSMFAGSVWAQDNDSDRRSATLGQAQAVKFTQLHPYVPGKVEKSLNRSEIILTSGMRLHPYFQSAYSGGGFTLGAGYRTWVGSYDTVDV